MEERKMLKIRRAVLRCMAALLMAAMLPLMCGCEEGQYIELPLDVLQQLASSQTIVSQSTMLPSTDAAALSTGEALASATPEEQPAGTALPEATLAPTSTPAVTPTPMPSATPTPLPSATPLATPVPTSTPAPTATPAPSATPLATPAPEAGAQQAVKQENEKHEAELSRLRAAYDTQRVTLEATRSMLMMEPNYSDPEFNAELEKNTMALDIAKVEYETAVAAENARHESELSKLGAQ